MGRVGACGDNAAMDSFFALVQKNILDRQRWSTREQLRLALVTWIEKTYHRDAVNDASASSLRSSLRQSTGPHTRPESPNPTSQPKWGAVPPARAKRSGTLIFGSIGLLYKFRPT